MIFIDEKTEKPATQYFYCSVIGDIGSVTLIVIETIAFTRLAAPRNHC